MAKTGVPIAKAQRRGQPACGGFPTRPAMMSTLLLRCQAGVLPMSGRDRRHQVYFVSGGKFPVPEGNKADRQTKEELEVVAVSKRSGDLVRDEIKHVDRNRRLRLWQELAPQPQRGNEREKSDQSEYQEPDNSLRVRRNESCQILRQSAFARFRPPPKTIDRLREMEPVVMGKP